MPPSAEIAGKTPNPTTILTAPSPLVPFLTPRSSLFLSFLCSSLHSSPSHPYSILPPPLARFAVALRRRVLRALLVRTRARDAVFAPFRDAPREGWDVVLRFRMLFQLLKINLHLTLYMTKN